MPSHDKLGGSARLCGHCFEVDQLLYGAASGFAYTGHLEFSLKQFLAKHSCHMWGVARLPATLGRYSYPKAFFADPISNLPSGDNE